MSYDFDTIHDRRGTSSLKYDFGPERAGRDDLFPMWVADMDFETAPEIKRAIVKAAEHGIYGYTEAKQPYFEAAINWLRDRQGWDVDRRWIIKTPGVVFALATAIKAFTNEGDSVLIQQPVYYPFSEVINDNNRNLISSDLKLIHDDEKTEHYEIDFEDLESKIVENKVKLFLLCNPHNPVGRVWTREELQRIGDLCLAHDVIVISDEIHGDFIFSGHKFVPYYTLGERYADKAVICTSPSKTFNIAGVQASNIITRNLELRKKFKKAFDASGYSQLNTFGVIAAQAAYEWGGPWYEEMLNYIEANKIYFEERISKMYDKGIKLRYIPAEGTYLLWVDFSGLGLGADEVDDIIKDKAHLWLDSGKIFGESGRGFQRFNIACPRKILEKALDALEEAFIGSGR